MLWDMGALKVRPATAELPAAEACVTVDWPASVLQVQCVEGEHVDAGQKLFVVRPARISGENEPASNADYFADQWDGCRT